MKSHVNRRLFLGGAAVLAVGPVAAQDPPKPKQPEPKAPPKPRPPALSAELVKEFVAVCHSKMDKTKEMLKEHPALINATWDWGGGDFETGLGGASHVGSRDIALFLLENKARLDIFAAAMLGKLEIVKASLTAFPAALYTPGPHGIPLFKHAKAGGKEAEPVVEYLLTLDPKLK